MKQKHVFKDAPLKQIKNGILTCTLPTFFQSGNDQAKLPELILKGSLDTSSITSCRHFNNCLLLHGLTHGNKHRALALQLDVCRDVKDKLWRIELPLNRIKWLKAFHSLALFKSLKFIGKCVSFQNTSECSLFRFPQRQRKEISCFDTTDIFLNWCVCAQLSIVAQFNGCQNRHPITKSNWSL